VGGKRARKNKSLRWGFLEKAELGLFHDCDSSKILQGEGVRDAQKAGEATVLKNRAALGKVAHGFKGATATEKTKN